MTDFVLDASVVANWVLVDEQNAASDAVQDQLSSARGLVPPLFWHELQSVLLKAERRGRCTIGEADGFLADLRVLPIAVAPNRSDTSVLALARVHRLSAYDAAYLDLATSLTLPLATADRRLAAGAHAAGVTVLGPYAITAS